MEMERLVPISHVKFKKNMVSKLMRPKLERQYRSKNRRIIFTTKFDRSKLLFP
jgi:hypothetical protein